MTSRREFLQMLGTGGLIVGGCRAATRQNNLIPSPNVQPPAEILPHRVALVRDEAAISGTEIDVVVVEHMLDLTMSKLTSKNDPAATWQALFKPDDVVAIKVNCLAGPPLSSHPPLVNAIAQRLRTYVGINGDQIIVYDRNSTELAAVGFEPGSEAYQVIGSDEAGYDADPTTWGQAGSCYSRIVSEAATAIINVPVLKDHDLAGLSGALKNHFGSIHNPNKLHMDHCCPYVADVNCSPHLREKHRLVIYDALLVCYDGGPGYKPDTTVAYGALMAAVDPVAADTVGFSILEKLRAEQGLPPIANSERAPKYLQVAADAEHALGIADLKRIEVC
ncbi:MAG: DUF362 domain-containing protein [Candidatus Zipacnadales bacterium]